MLASPSLRVLLPAVVTTIFVVTVLVALAISITLAEKSLIDQSRKDIRRDIAKLSNLAQKTISGDSQLLEDAMTQLSTNPIVKNTAVITPSGHILFASNFSWRGEPAVLRIPDFSHHILTISTQSLSAYIEELPQHNTIIAAMSFNYPASEPTIRSLKKGVVFVSYDISDKLYEARVNAFYKQTPELISIFVLILVLIEVLRRYVISPLSRLQSATKEIAQGSLSSPISLAGSSEVRDLTKSFNQMNERLVASIKKLDDRKTQIQGILDNTFDGIIAINSKGSILSFNKTAETMFGLQANEVVGKNVNILMPTKLSELHDQFINNFLDGNEAKIIGSGREVEGLRANGETFPMDLAITQVQSNEETMFIGILRDITERKEKEAEVLRIQKHLATAIERLEKLAITDVLTDVANRRCFDDTLAQEFNRARRSHQSLSLLLFDLDHFKLYNDHYGHQPGDECLKRVAQAAKKSFQRSGELVARYGGEEFAVILPSTDIAEAVTHAENLVRKVSQLNIEHTQSKTFGVVTISVGVASLNTTIHQSFDDLIREADNALYQAKKNGRNQASIYKPDRKINLVK